MNFWSKRIKKQKTPSLFSELYGNKGGRSKESYGNRRQRRVHCLHNCSKIENCLIKISIFLFYSVCNITETSVETHTSGLYRFLQFFKFSQTFTQLEQYILVLTNIPKSSS